MDHQLATEQTGCQNRDVDPFSISYVASGFLNMAAIPKMLESHGKSHGKSTVFTSMTSRLGISQAYGAGSNTEMCQFPLVICQFVT